MGFLGLKSGLMIYCSRVSVVITVVMVVVTASTFSLDILDLPGVSPGLFLWMGRYPFAGAGWIYVFSPGSVSWETVSLVSLLSPGYVILDYPCSECRSEPSVSFFSINFSNFPPLSDFLSILRLSALLRSVLGVIPNGSGSMLIFSASTLASAGFTSFLRAYFVAEVWLLVQLLLIVEEFCFSIFLLGVDTVYSVLVFWYLVVAPMKTFPIIPRAPFWTGLGGQFLISTSLSSSCFRLDEFGPSASWKITEGESSETFLGISFAQGLGCWAEGAGSSDLGATEDGGWVVLGVLVSQFLLRRLVLLAYELMRQGLPPAWLLSSLIYLALSRLIIKY